MFFGQKLQIVPTYDTTILDHALGAAQSPSTQHTESFISEGTEQETCQNQVSQYSLKSLSQDKIVPTQRKYKMRR